MSVFFTLEASKPSGTTYRLALRCTLPLGIIASMLAILSRFF